MYEKLYDLNNLYKAFLKCKKNVSWKESVQKYEANLLLNLINLSEELKNETYKQSKFYEFDINERGKKRHIKSLPIKDRIVQSVLCDEILNPILTKYLVYDNGASQKGKGISFTRKRIVVHLEKFYRECEGDGYVLQIDFSKFFDSIPHKTIFEQLADKVDEKTLKLIKQLVNSFGEERSVGLGSRISQNIGIYYLTKVDNYCKTVRRCKYYGRYMDDIYIFDKDKEKLRDILNNIIKIANELGLNLNSKKTKIVKIKDGFTFMNIRYFYGKNGKIIRVPAKKTIIRERRKLKKLKNKLSKEKIKEQYKSWRGNIKKFNSHNSLKRMDKLVKSILNQKNN